MEKNKFIKYQLIISFLIIILLPALLGFSGIEGFARKDENRAFKDSVSLNINRLDDFPSDFDAFLDDNFYFRSPLLDIFHRTKYFVFKTSSHPDKTLIGDDGWFYKAGVELEVLSGKLDFSPETLEAFTNEWKRRTAYLEERNIPVFWIIAPMKHHVYTDQLPFNIHLSKTNRIDGLIAHLKPDFPNLIIYPIPELRANRDKANLYFKLDNHWNEHAGYITTQLLIEKLRVQFPDKDIIDIPKFHWEGEVIHKGIHYNVMGIDELSEYSETVVMNNPQSREADKFGFEPIAGFAYPWSYEYFYVNDSLKNGLRVLFIRDSFGEAIIPFTSEVFKESLYIFDAWQFKLNEEIIEQFKPDVVVFIGLETNPENMLKK